FIIGKKIGSKVRYPGFTIPYGFLSKLVPKQMNRLTISLWIIGINKTDQGAFSGTIGPLDIPLLTCEDPPVDIFQDFHLAVLDIYILHFNLHLLPGIRQKTSLVLMELCNQAGIECRKCHVVVSTIQSDMLN